MGTAATEHEAAETEAFTKGKHMQCVLAGTDPSACEVGTIPSASPITLAPGVDGTDCPAPSSTLTCDEGHWLRIADERTPLPVQGDGQDLKVRYGVPGHYKYKTFAPGVAAECNNGVFGDPISGTMKHCDFCAVPHPSCAGNACCSHAGWPCAQGCNPGAKYYVIGDSGGSCHAVGVTGLGNCQDGYSCSDCNPTC